ncbi:glutamate racemase [Treponema primitia]|uniref:glutamate racemase n=1 Tax=Treponema primitia TaxID=88058 RepID=UPI0039811BC9
MDSGIGGLPYYHHFHKANPEETLVCLADREYFPYGSKDRPELILRLTELLNRLRRRYDPKLGVLACNTASISALQPLRESFPDLPLVGTVPAVKLAVLASKKRHIGVLGTSRTIGDPYIAELTAEFGADCALTAIAAPDLVEFVEHRYAESDAQERLAAVLPYINQFRSAGVDAIVLGCTHFFFLQDVFKAAAWDMSIHDSLDGVSHRVEALLDQGDLRAEAGGRENILFITGKGSPEPVWQERARAFGLTLRTEQDYCS